MITQDNKSKYIIVPWNPASKGASGLRRSLNIRRLRPEGSTFRGGPNHTVINWGCSSLPENTLGCKIINKPEEVSAMTDKKKFFEMMNKGGSSPRTPEFTSDKDQAIKWAGQGIEVVARTVLNGHSGKGIVFFNDVKSFVSAQLYTKYVKKKEEYRVHIFRGDVIDVQRKVLRKTDDAGNKIDPDTIDFRIRSFSNGFIFQRQGIHPSPDVLDQAVLAFNKTGLDFGAVDVIYNDHANQAYVLEINTAPGIEGETLENYTRVFQNEL